VVVAQTARLKRLREGRRDCVPHNDPEQYAEPDRDHQSEVQVPSRGLGARIQDVTFLGFVAIVQISWLLLIGYAAFTLL
jgi:hypothetical protein